MTTGVTECSQAVNFVTRKFASWMHVLSERARLYSTKKKTAHSVNDFPSELRQVARFCNFPAVFPDYGLMDALCQGLPSNAAKRAMGRSFATGCQRNKVFSLLSKPVHSPCFFQ